ncbi:MAG: hypothetical protein JJ899_06085 [Alphaproteobacteria bacterium]|nr:hypothetical protein [Alphaproteobacteria bacterium]
MMDNAIWATWYDLPDDGRDGFLDWLHGDYLPGLQARPGIAWAAHYENDGGGEGMAAVRAAFPDGADMAGLGDGTQYVMLVGAGEAWTFLAPSVVEEQAGLTGKARDMLDLRTGLRTCIFSVYASVNGPEIHTRTKGTTPAPAIQMGSFRAMDVETEFDTGAWYAQYRLPAMARMPGCVATRVMVSVAGWAKYSILYEFTSLEDRMKSFEEPHEALALDEKEWSGRVIRRLYYTPGSPIVGRRIWPPVE